ncbi:MAG: GSCFA domain-containing protein [Sphingomonas bacterium]
MQKKKIVVIGNCLSMAISTVCRSYFPEADVINLHFERKDIVEQFQLHAPDSDLILAQIGLDENIYPEQFNALVTDFIRTNAQRCLRYPRIVFAGFQPDCTYAWSRDGGGGIDSPFGYHSAIAVEAFRRGYSVNETMALYNADVFEALGYFDYYEPSIRALEEECQYAGLPQDVFPRKWFGLPFMLTINHPRMYVAWDLTEHLLRRAGFELPLIDRERNQMDSFFLGPIWPVYPEIARRLGVPGSYDFMPTTDFSPNAQHEIHDLRGFIEKSFQHYRTLDFSLVALSQPTTTHFNQIDSALFDNAFVARRETFVPPPKLHPYSIVTDSQMWRRAVSDVACGDIDPVVDVPFGIVPDTRIATAGSCFAQHIAKALERSGYSYFVTEQPAAGVSEEMAQSRNYGVFSARYGNLYTARQLLQLVRRAYGEFEPEDRAWLRDDGRYVDPFRPQIEPEGFACEEDVIRSRDDHFQAVRQIIEQSDVFVFTLGLTEGWRRRSDGAVFPLAPGVAGGKFDIDRYEFINFRASEVIDDMAAAITEMRRRNPALRFILTVSPVPLIATAEARRHVLTATTYSKSVLRVAAEELSKTMGDIAYFPSYEIITGNFNRGAYYADDLREVRMEGVNHVMRLFFKHFAIENWQKDVAVSGADKSGMRSRMEEQIRGLYKVVCDEETIERMAGV